MSNEQSMIGAPMRWMAIGALLGAVGVAGGVRVLGSRGGASGSGDTAVVNGSAGTERGAADMSGMDMGSTGMPGMESGSASMPGMNQESGDESDMAMAGMAMPGSDAVRLTPSQIRQFGVTFATVEERRLETRVRTVGVVQVDETRLVEVVTKFPGYVERLYADFTGKVVREGEALLDVYSPELVAAQEEVLLARELQSSLGVGSIPGVASPTVDLEATARRRLTLWDITDDQIETLLSNREPSRTLSLRAPITGTVLEKRVVAGGAFRAGEVLFRLADLSTVWIDVEIRERDAARVELGSPAVATLTSYPGERFPGVVDFIYPTVDEQARSVRARVVLPNPTGRLRPGMYATVVVTTPVASALAVPSDAVVWTGETTLLFVVDGDGGIRPVEIELGAPAGDQIVVLSGASSGDTVVSAAQYLIDAEANIGAIMRSMMSMMGSGDMAGMDMDSEGMEMDSGGMDAGAGSMDGMDMPVDTLSPGR
jgi:membrane fusion protein, copper/silver efflux system